MKNVKAMLSLKIVNFKESRHCLLNKNITVVLIVLSMCVKGIVPKEVNINKNSLDLARDNAVIDILKRCKETLIIICSKISKESQNFLFQRFSNSSDISAQRSSQNKPNKESTTNKRVVIINGRSNKNKMKKIFIDNFILDYGFIFFVKLFKLYMSYKELV